MNKAQNRPTLHKVLSMILALVMVLSLLPMSGFTAYDAQTTAESSSESTEFMRIFHLDCGRKYFTVAQIEELIDTAAENNYTHVELAFGNDGLRFLLDNMELTVGDTTYNSNDVTNAIKKGNKAYNSSANYSSQNSKTNELTEDEMGAIITYANSKGIGIIPMFDAPGHMYAVIEAMKELELNVTSYQATTSGASANMAINPTDSTSLDFVLALMNKYITYFAGKGCGYFNFAADECGFTNFNNANCNMTSDEYTAYANFVNSMAAAVKNANMTPMAFNDGIYHIGLTLNDSVAFDTDIYICYWDASTDKYAPAAELAEKGFKIINTHNKWYYVVGNTGSSTWYGDEWSKKNMQGTNGNCSAPKCNVTDGDYTTTTGCMNAVWCDNPSVEYSTYASTIKDHIVTLANVEYNKSFFVASSTDVDPVEPSTTPDTDKGSTDTEELPKETITVTVNESGDVVIDGSHVGTEGDPITIDEYASYKITHNTTQTGGTATKATSLSTGEYIIGNNSQWLVLNGSTVSSTADSSAATKWTITKSGSSYTIQSGNYYLYGSSNDVYASTSSFNWSWSSNNGFYFTSTSNNKTRYLYYSSKSTEWKVSDNRENKGGANPYMLVGGEDVLSTTITFYGLKVGESKYVTIGDKQYNVNVIAEKVDGITLPIQTWITNAAIQMDSVTTHTSGAFGGENSQMYGYYASIKAADAYGVDGAELSKLVPVTKSGLKEYGGVYWDESFQNTGKVEKTSGSKAVSDFSTRTARTLDLLKGSLLSSGSYQTIWDSNQIESGTDFKYVRYYNKAWAVSSDRVTWTPVTAGAVTTGSSSSSGTQIVAYYMLRTDVTKEVTTDVIDWGDALPTKGSKVILDYAVKYENGQLVPSDFPVSGKTMFFNLLNVNDTYRRIYDIKGLEENGYEIYMITVTPNSDSKNYTISLTEDQMPSYSYKGTEKVAWVASEDDLPNAFKDQKYTSISGTITYKVGGEPTISGVEIYSGQAMLVTYYIREIKTADSLTVHYVNQQTGKEIHSYNINVKSTASNPTLFDANIALNETNWKGPLDNGTVTNDMGVEITVSADLSTMPAISAEYRYSNYTCVDVQHSNDLKEVFLYYTFGYDITFVVDFGLPITIAPEKLSDNITGANITKADVTSSSYANVTVNNDYSITYALKEAISAEDNFTVTYYGTNLTTGGDGQITFNVRIIPASTVYYEDGFANFNSGKYTADSKETEVAWNIEGSTETNVTQALEALGDKKNVYGYDEAYDNSTLYSLGSAHKVTVSADMAKDTSVVWPSATFTFKGTGFDIISLTDNNSGAISVKVYKVESDGTETQVKGTLVNNYYGYTYSDGVWTATPTADNNALYQIPVIKISGLDYATYKVLITVSYATYADKTGDNEYSFWLDGIRVYDPMCKDNNTYVQDNEGYPQYIKLRDELADEAGIAESKVVFIDGAKEAEIATYANYGPNNEVYLAKGQAISFTIPADSNIASIQVGAKSPSGTAKMNVIANEDTVLINNKEISTATEMYYALNADASTEDVQITISNTGDGILSLTNLKLTFKSAPSSAENAIALMALDTEEQEVAVMAVRALFAAPTPDPEPSTDPEPTPDPEPEVKTFEPATFKVSLNKDSIREGQKATLTVKASAEVEAITVNGVTYDEYQTRLERSGWKWWSADRTEYHVFTVTLTPTETTDYEVIAVDAEGAVSEAETVTLTVKAAQSNWWEDMWNGFFGKWF